MVLHGDASGSRSPPADASNIKQLFSQLDALVTDLSATTPRPVPATAPLEQSRKPLNGNDSTQLSEIDEVLYRSQVDSECLRQQLKAAMLERDDMHKRLTLVEQRKHIEPDIRESLKSEFRINSSVLQQQLSETLPTIVSEVRRTVHAEVMRSKSRDADTSNEMARQIDSLNRNLNSFANMIHERTNSKGDVDFPMVLKAIQEHNTEMNSNFSYVSTQIRDFVDATGPQANSSVDLSIVLQELHASRLEGNKSLVATMQKLLSESRAELESNVLKTTAAMPGQDSTLMNEQFALVHDAIRQHRNDVNAITDALRDATERKHNPASMHDSFKVLDALQEVSQKLSMMNDLVQLSKSRPDHGGLHDAIQDQRRQMDQHFNEVHDVLKVLPKCMTVSPIPDAVLMHNEEMSRLLKQINDSLERPRSTSEANLEPVLKEVLGVQKTIQQEHDTIHKQHAEVQHKQIDIDNNVRQWYDATQKHHEDITRNLSLMLHAVEQKASIGYDFQSLHDSIRSNNELLLKMDQRETAINGEVSQLLKQQSGSKSDFNFEPSLKELLGIQYTMKAQYDVIQKCNEDANDKLSRLHEMVQQNHMNIDFQPFHESIQKNNDMLRAMQQRETPAINEEVRQLLKQMNDNLQQPGSKSDLSFEGVLKELQGLQNAMQKQQADNEDVSQLLKQIHAEPDQIGKNLQSLHDSIQNNKADLLNAMKQRETPAINEDVRQLLNQMHATSDQTGKHFQSLHDSIQKNKQDLLDAVKQRESPAVNEDVRQLLNQMNAKSDQSGKDFQSLLDSIQKDKEDLLNAVKQRESPAVNEEMSRLLTQLHHTSQQYAGSDLSPRVNNAPPRKNSSELALSIKPAKAPGKEVEIDLRPTGGLGADTGVAKKVIDLRPTHVVKVDVCDSNDDNSISEYDDGDVGRRESVGSMF